MSVYLDDVCSDLSVFHGIRDATRLDSAVFFQLAVRLPAYRGAVAAAILADRSDSPESAQQAPVARPQEPRPINPDDDLRSRFMAAQSLPVATAAQLAGITRQASMPGDVAGTVVQVPAT